MVRQPKYAVVVLAITLAAASLVAWNWLGASAEVPPRAPSRVPDGWTTTAPRNEIRPDFDYDSKGGADGKGCFVISADRREGLAGCWKKTFPVTGGKTYHFAASYQAKGVTLPRRSVVVELHWTDAKGQKVPLDQQPVTGYLRGATAIAETEFPTTKGTDRQGWTEVSDTYQAPSKATQAIVELHLRWAANSEVRWSSVALTETDPPAPRKVRLAAVHFKPKDGKTPMDNCRMYEPLIAEAARQKADLVVLGETLTFVGLGKKYHEVAEPIPGPSTDYFGELAKKHNLYIVPGLLERDGHLVYNVAVLIGPDGKVIGKYRKTCLPRGEIEGGLTPGSEYPVFSTRFGKVGLMVCYDGFFPEVARELSNRGAEVIAWPVWGCNPMLARARLREPRLSRQQHLRGCSQQLDGLGGFRSHRRNHCPGQRLGHSGGHGSGPRQAHEVGQPRRFQGRNSATSPVGCWRIAADFVAFSLPKGDSSFRVEQHVGEPPSRRFPRHAFAHSHLPADRSTYVRSDL